MCLFKLIEDTAMSDETFRSANRRGFWLAIAITLGPLAVMPLGNRTSVEPSSVRLSMQDRVQPAQIQSPAADARGV
jgi:hypothetical protein